VDPVWSARRVSALSRNAVYASHQAAGMLTIAAARHTTPRARRGLPAIFYVSRLGGTAVLRPKNVEVFHG